MTLLMLQEIMTEDHWLRMRDTGFVDEEGFLHLTGRCSDMVMVGAPGAEESVCVTPMEQRVRLELACVAQAELDMLQKMWKKIFQAF